MIKNTRCITIINIVLICTIIGCTYESGQDSHSEEKPSVYETTSSVLLQTVLSDPYLFAMIGSSSSHRQGFNKAYRQISALRELILLEDFGKVLTDYYCDMVSIRLDGRMNTELLVLEWMMQQPEFTAVLTDEELSSVANEADRKYLERPVSGVHTVLSMTHCVNSPTRRCGSMLI